MTEKLSDVIKDLRAKYNLKQYEELTPEQMMQEKVDYYNASVGKLNEIDGYNCTLCKNKGFIASVKNGYEVHAFCKCKTIRDTLNRAKKSGLGNVLSEFTFDKYKASESWQKNIKDKAIAFCKDAAAKWFYIGGQVGSGKTFICTAISGYYIKAGYNVKYMLWSEESKKLKALVKEAYDYQNLISIYKNIDVLYIDDFLKVKNGEEPTTADINLAFEVINHRLLDGSKITIISSEKTLTEMIEYDEATMSRIYEKTGGYKISIERDINKNYRLRG